MTLNVPTYNDFIDKSGNLSKSAVNYLNQVSTRLDAIATIATPASPNATDLATVITLANELKTILAALVVAANR